MINYVYPSPARTNSGAIACVALAVDGATATASFGETVDLVEIQVKTDAVSYTTDGTTPTSTAGIALAAGTIQTWSHAKWRQAKFIKVTNAATVYACPYQL
jgi:hypothetical protein